jgi:ABC-type polysaccharide/polyol phosphate transport system ATPase subunit
METDIALKCADVSKVYKLYDRNIDRLKETVSLTGRRYHREFFALRDVSFEARKGECLGIVGSNGSGKSTLLKMIAGVLTPTSGALEIHGTVSALLELGVGFNPNMTGLENIYFNGALMGRDRHEMSERLASIQAFADIKDFIRQPVKTYSTGMFMRLAFASAIDVDPDVMIIDEALAVGDMRFQQKCFRKIKEISQQGKTILFVSHDMGAVVNLCHRAIWLKDNTIHRSGPPDEIAREYIAEMAYGSPTRGGQARGRRPDSEPSDAPLWEDTSRCSSFGDGGAQIKKAAFSLRDTGRSAAVLQGGEDVVFAVEISVGSDLQLPIIGFVIKDELGNSMLGINTSVYAAPMRPLLKGEDVRVEFRFKFPLFKNGSYSFSPAIADGTQDNHVQHHWVHDVCVIQVASPNPKHTIGCYLVVEDAQIELKPAASR